ncbi:MAG: divergent PAP2 family protein [Candidatus Omnitrophica bacterium]|nr:divergent PAP2 family protein [Candidatus Omnitrophota bacterium]
MMGEIFENKILISTFFAWITAQTIKVIIGIIKDKHFDFRWFIGPGGMPSSHTAGVSCLATYVGLEYGFKSVYFALASVFALIVMFDAQSVRRATGKQAEILNKITDDIYWRGKFDQEKLRELIGHTPFEAIMGFFLGIAAAIISDNIFNK